MRVKNVRELSTILDEDVNIPAQARLSIWGTDSLCSDGVQ
jgi:hypothetical protein